MIEGTYSAVLPTVYPKKYAHGVCFAVLCCDYILTAFPISIRLTSLALWQSNECPSPSKATLMNMDKYFMWIHYERLHNHNKAKHNKTVCIFLGIYCSYCMFLMCTARGGSMRLRHTTLNVNIHIIKSGPFPENQRRLYCRTLYIDTSTRSVCTPTIFAIIQNKSPNLPNLSQYSHKSLSGIMFSPSIS